MKIKMSKRSLLASLISAAVLIGALLSFSCSSSSSSTSSTSSSSTPAQTGGNEVQASGPQQLWYKLKPVKIAIPEEVAEEAALTRNFYFIMDGSGSMNEATDSACGGDQQFRDKISGARWAVKKFLENVPTDVCIGLYVFDYEGTREVVPLGSGNRAQFIQAIDKINAGGGTPLAEAIRFGADQLVEQYKKQLGYGEFRLVVVTDGKATGIPEAAIYAAGYGVPIYAIGLCIGMDHPLRNYSVSYRAADNFADLSQGLQETLAEIPDFDVTKFDKALLPAQSESPPAAEK